MCKECENSDFQHCKSISCNGDCCCAQKEDENTLSDYQLRSKIIEILRGRKAIVALDILESVKSYIKNKQNETRV